MPQENNPGLIAAYALNGEGGGRKLDWAGIRAWTPKDGTLLVYLDYAVEDAQRWLSDESGVDEIIRFALVEEDTRPRSTVITDGLLSNLRVVNFNPGADPEDMVSLRSWFEKDRVFFSRHRRVVSVEEMCQAIDAGQGPRNTAEVLIDITDRIVQRIWQIVEDIDQHIDTLEDELVTTKNQKLLREVPAIRRQAISLRRYLIPQREALTRIATERVSWLDESNRFSMREIADRMARVVEDIEESRDHAMVLQEEMDTYLTRDLNKRIYFLTIVSAIFLPLTFLTGLLGMNVGGIPGADQPKGFYEVTVALTTLALVMLAALKIRRWF